MSILIAFIVFGVLVFIHELGHMLLAKKNRIGVSEFSIGMGPRLFSFDKGGTKYSLKLIPFGGSCMMIGEMDESDAEDAFNNRSVWARISVVAAGPIFNIVLAFLFSIIIIGVAGYDPAVVTSVDENSAAYAAGLRKGDRIVEYNGVNVIFGREIYLEEYIDPVNDATPIELTYERDGEEYEISIIPDYHEPYYIGINYTPTGEYAEILGLVEGGAMQAAGVQVGDKIVAFNGIEFESGEALGEYLAATDMTEEPVTVTLDRNGERYSVTVTPKKSPYYSSGFTYNMYRVDAESPLKTLKYSVCELKYQISSVYKSLLMLFKGQLGMNDLSGPVGIVDMVGTVVEESQSDDVDTMTNVINVLLNVLNLTVILSVSLGIMNLLPLPALDGGRLVFLVIEAVRGKPISREKESIVHFIGFALLMILMVVVLFNDVRKIFF